MTHDDTMVLVARLSRDLPTILPGVTFQRLQYCDWLACSELQAKGSLLPMGYLAKLHSALDRLHADHPWEVIHDYGQVHVAGTEILDHVATYVSFAPGEEETIYWGCFVLGPRIAFTYCRPDQVPPAFLPASSPLTQESL